MHAQGIDGTAQPVGAKTKVIRGLCPANDLFFSVPADRIVSWNKWVEKKTAQEKKSCL